MEVYETEEQQIEALKAWFKKRAKLLTVGLTLMALATSGALYTRHHIKVTQEEASHLYQAMITAIEKEDSVTAKTKATRLSDEYSTSVYGSIAKLYLAKTAFNAKKLEEAKVQLEWVIQHAKHAEFQELARLRLAKILFSEKKGEAALRLLSQSNKKEDHYLSLLQELKADILKTQDKRTEAHELYKQAHEAILKKELNNPLLKIKIEELGEG